MYASKCQKCGLVDAGSDTRCRRCGYDFALQTLPRYSGPREAARRFSLWPFIGLAVVVGFLMYIYSGVEKESRAIQSRESNRQPSMSREPAGLSRSEHDNRRAGQYKNAIQSAPALAEAQKRNEESRKLMQSAPRDQKQDR